MAFEAQALPINTVAYYCSMLKKRFRACNSFAKQFLTLKL